MTRTAPIAPRFFRSKAEAVALLRSVYEFAKHQLVLDTEDGILLSVMTDSHKGLQLQVHEVWAGTFVIVKSCHHQHAVGDGWVQEVITPSTDPNRLGEAVPSPFAGPTPIGKVAREFAEQHGDDADAWQCMIREFFIERGSRIVSEQDDDAIQTVFYDDCGLTFDDLIEEGYRDDLAAQQECEQERAESIAEEWRYR